LILFQKVEGVDHTFVAKVVEPGDRNRFLHLLQYTAGFSTDGIYAGAGKIEPPKMPIRPDIEGHQHASHRKNRQDDAREDAPMPLHRVLRKRSSRTATKSENTTTEAK